MILGRIMKKYKNVLILIILFAIIAIFTGAVSATHITAPRVSSVDPVNNSFNVPSYKVITVEFSKSIKEGNKWSELKNNKNSISTTNTITNNTLTLKPNTILKNGTKYTLILHSGSYKDLSGNPVALYSTCFTVSKTFSSVYLKKIQTDKIINGKQYYAQYAIYQKPTNSNYWNRYLIYHIVNQPETGVNGPENEYRIYKLQNVISDNTHSFIDTHNFKDLTAPGNWEKALQLSETPLIGGMHGYELYTNILFYENGLRIIPGIDHPITSCNDLQIIENSNLLNPNNLSQVIAATTTSYDWNGQDLNIHTIYNWKINATVTTAYAAMFPIINDPTVSSIGQISGLPIENFLTRTIELRGDSAKGTVWNNINNLHMSMEILNPSTALNNYLNNGDKSHGKTWFRTLNAFYNKLYITRVDSPGYESVNNTSRWDIQTRYTIWNG
jgi:hypothetical protein